MSDALNFAELDRQHVELLAARTVLSLLHAGGGQSGSAHSGDSGGGDVLSSVTDLLHGNSVGNAGTNANGGNG